MQCLLYSELNQRIAQRSKNKNRVKIHGNIRLWPSGLWTFEKIFQSGDLCTCCRLIKDLGTNWSSWGACRGSGTSLKRIVEMKRLPLSYGVEWTLSYVRVAAPYSDFQNSPTSDFIWRGTKDDLSRLRRSRSAASGPKKARSARQEVDLLQVYSLLRIRKNGERAFFSFFFGEGVRRNTPGLCVVYFVLSVLNRTGSLSSKGP